jgi:hypothetical protein
MVIPLIAEYLTHITTQNDKFKTHKLTRFHAKAIPSIDISAYLQRIIQYAPCGTDCLLSMLLYLEIVSKNHSLLYQDSIEKQMESTALEKNDYIVLDSFNIHRLIVTSAMVSIKFLSDVFYTNLHFSSNF